MSVARFKWTMYGMEPIGDEKRPGYVSGIDYNVLAAQVSVMQTDLAAILRATGLSDAARPYSSHEVVWRDLLPHLAALAERAERLHKTLRERAP